MTQIGRALDVLHADFTGTATNMFEVTATQPPSEITISITDQGSSADGVYYLQHLDYTTEESPAWVNMSGSDDAITANASGSITKIFKNLSPGLYRFNTASEAGTVDIFIYGQSIELDNLTDPTS